MDRDDMAAGTTASEPTRESREERKERLEALFTAGRKLPAEERAAYLDRACAAGDPSLRAEVEELLACLERAPAALGTGKVQAALLEAAAPAGKTRAPAPPPAMVGPYRVEAELGRGGMGVVYLAHDERLGRKVALKSVPEAVAADPVARAHLTREARALALINHPSVATIHGLEEADGRLFLVLELVEGESLAERLRRGPLEVKEALRVGARVAAALEEAHERGIVHRDLKPANVMCGDRGQVKVLDFGLASAVGETGAEPRTHTGQLAGTPGYMSPEQVAGEGADALSDVWAFGCLLYECLSGKAAFPGDTVGERLLGPLERLPDWTLLPADIPAPVRELVERCLAREPGTRPTGLGPVRLQLERDGQTPSGGEPAARHTLPAERDAFVGRAAELDEIAARFAAGARHVTLLGAGGSGKTRLACRFGRKALASFPGGVWLADLSTARSIEEMVSAVGSGLGVPLGAGDPVVQLGHAMAGRGRCLVVLDNFEQVVEHAPATLGRWTERAQEAAFLVTSRRRLELKGEEVLAVEPLPVATDGRELFDLRARAQRLDWSPAEEARAAVVEVVRLLDGLPLAIELAAARVRVLSPAQIRERLQDRFALLVGGKGSPSRHATLRAAIDWSWDLLTPRERAALGQCSVFEGGFTLEAAEAVVGGSDLGAEGPVLDVVQALVDRSLLQASGGGDEEPRFGMHASIKEYAADKLRAAGAEAEQAALERHGRHYARYGNEEAIDALFRHGGVERRRRLERELENLVAACQRAIERRDGEAATAALAAAWEVLRVRGPMKRGLELGRTTLAIREPGPTLRARVLEVTGQACHWLGTLHEEARRHFEEALAIQQELGNRRAEGSLLYGLGKEAWFRGRIDEARARFEAALAVDREVGYRAGEGITLAGLGLVARSHGRMEEARRYTEEALAIAREIGNSNGESVARFNLGSLQSLAEEQRRCYEGALAIDRASGDRAGEAVDLEQLAQLHSVRGSFEDAGRLYLEALAISRETGDRRVEGICLTDLGNLRVKQGKKEEARLLYQGALAINREVRNGQKEASILGTLGWLAMEESRLEEARRYLGEALAIFRRLDPSMESILLGWLGILEARQGRFDDARKSLADAEAIVRHQPRREYLAAFLCSKCECEYLAGDAAAACESLTGADAITSECGFGPESDLGRSIARLRALLSGDARP